MIYCEKGQKPGKEGKAMLKDVSSSAAALYDGGWRSADADQLRTEYDLTEEETQELCAALADLEEKKQIISTPPTLAGLFFCLTPAEGVGLLFCHFAIQPHTSVYSVFCVVNAIIPSTLQNGLQGFTGAFPTIYPILPPQIPDRHKRL